MSADRQRLTSAIRRIAKTDPDIRDLLKAADNKGGKPGSAGVGSSTDAESQRICCDGSTSDNANPGTDERDPDGDGAGQGGGLNSDDPAKLDMGEGTLSGVTDCATGEPICFDGGGFIPPDGWDDPSEGPIEFGYEFGCKWYLTGNELSGPYYVSAQAAMDSLPGEFINPPEQKPHFGCAGYYMDLGVRIVDGVQRVSPDAYSTTCESGDPSSTCPDEDNPPREDTWPADSCVNLAIINGTIVGSKYDPENDGSYSAPRDSIDLCSGTDQISLAPAANGGWKTINSTTNNGYLYDSSSKQIAHIDGNEYSDPTM